VLCQNVDCRLAQRQNVDFQNVAITDQRSLTNPDTT
jgi:hypothetical protein